MHKISARRDYVCEGDGLFGPKTKQGNTHEMKAKTTKAALFAAITGLVFAAFAANFDLPTPPPSPFPDTESPVNVAVTNGPSLGRRVQLILSAHATPSNCVQIAFGQDTNADGDLAPEETHLVLGVDCGVPFIREEFGQWRSDTDQWRSDVLIASEQESNLDCPPQSPGSTSTFAFAFKQPSAITNRLTHAKVTTHNLADTNLVVAVEFYNRGQVLFLR